MKATLNIMWQGLVLFVLSVLPKQTPASPSSAFNGQNQHTPQKLRCASEMAAGVVPLCGLLRRALPQRGESLSISAHLLCVVFRYGERARMALLEPGQVPLSYPARLEVHASSSMTAALSARL